MTTLFANTSKVGFGHSEACEGTTKVRSEGKRSINGFRIALAVGVLSNVGVGISGSGPKSTFTVLITFTSPVVGVGDGPGTGFGFGIGLGPGDVVG